MPQALYGGISSSWTPANITVASAAALGLYFSDSGTLNGYADFSSAQLSTLLGNLTTGIYNNGLKAGSLIAFDESHGNATYSGTLADSTGPGGGSIGVNKLGGNTLTLSGNNTFSGPVTIGPSGTSGGTLRVVSLNSVNGGSPLLATSSLGCPTTVGTGTITCGNANSNQSVGLTYLGSGETTDRALAMNAGVSAGATALTLDQSGTGLLKFSSAMVYTGPTGARALVLQGSTAGTGELGGVLANPSGAGFLSLTKSGSGTWTLSAPNTYSGTTTVSAGTLLINGAQSGTGLVTVASGATLGGSGSIAAAVTFSTGAKAVFTVTRDPLTQANTTPLTLAGVVTCNSTVVHLNLPANLPSGTYTLATSSATPTGSVTATPVVDSGSYAAGFTSAVVSLDVANKRLLLTVNGLPTNPSQLAITAVNGGASPLAGAGFSVVVRARSASTLASVAIWARPLVSAARMIGVIRP